MFLTWGHLDAPIQSDAPICLDILHMFGQPLTPHMFTPPMSPMLPCASACSGGYLHVIGGCRDPPSVWTPCHVFGCLPMWPTPPHICMFSCMCVCYGGYLHVLWGNIPYVEVWGHQHICQTFSVCQYIHWMSIMLHLVPFLEFIMSQVTTSMAMTTTPPVTVVSSGMSSLSLVTMAPSLMGLSMLGQHDVVLPPPLTPRCSRGIPGHASVPQQQPPSLMPLQSCANFAIGSPQVGFFFRVEPPTILYIISLVSVLMSAFYF